MGYKVVIGVPSRGQVFIGASLFMAQQAMKGHSLYIQVAPLSVETARLQIIRHFLKTDKWTHLFWMDDDVTCPNGIIERLLSYNKPIVSAKYPLYFDKHIHSASYKLENDKYIPYSIQEKGFKEVDGIGLGACLVERSVIEKVSKYPCFQIIHNENGSIKCTDDFTFCKFAKFLKIPIYCDFDIECDHYKSVSLTEIWQTFNVDKK